uniref:Uncharacterized protein n=1 Tax=Romanomermis culicivorax TaxID=13658 RepID=A0A915HWZ1_ROMCU
MLPDKFRRYEIKKEKKWMEKVSFIVLISSVSQLGNRKAMVCKMTKEYEQERRDSNHKNENDIIV